MEDKLLIVDGNSVMHRGYHALPPLSYNGVYTNAVYGFFSTLLKVYQDFGFTHIGVAFDVSKTVFRHEQYAEYKANRKPMDDELRCQFPVVKEILSSMNVPILEKEGFEGDDMLGSSAKHFKDTKCFVLTGDKDNLQLIDDNTTILLSRKNDIEVFDEDHFKEVYGITPTQFIDVKALMGDTSDNIPGVPKVGEKTALKLITEHGSLDGVYENIESLKGKLKENLETYKDKAYLSQSLATIKTDIEIEVPLMSFEFGGFNKGVASLRKYGLDNLVKRIGELGEEPVEDSMEETAVQIEVPELTTVKTAVDLATAIMDLTGDKVFLYIDGDEVYFSDGVSNYKAEIERTLFGSEFDVQDVLQAMEKVCEDKDIVTCDAKKLYEYFEKANVDIPVNYDILIMAYLDDSNAKDYSLKSLVGKYLNDESICAYRLKAVYEILLGKLKDTNGLYEKIEHPLIKVLYSMEKEGFRIDVDKLKSIGSDFENRLNEYTSTIHEMAGSEFNISSPKQLSKVLFEDLKLTHGKKTKSGSYSTDAGTLENIKKEHSIVNNILEFRHLSKLKGTYIDGFLPLIDGNQRVHTEFLQTGTATGRLSSKEPNLQNIPVRTGEGRLIRSCFVAKPGYKLICADYSQIELRVLAHLSNDPILIDAFNKEQDIHARTASEIFNVPIEGVTSGLRRNAKAVNFGIIYGLSAYGLSENLDIPVNEAKKYIDDYLARYENVKGYMAGSIITAKEQGYTTTMFGRKREIKELKSSNKNIVAMGERIALNTPIQGTAADIIKLAMISLYEKLAGLDAKLILQVHDELIVEAKEDIADKVCDILKDTMENIIKLSVPLTVDIKICDSWE